MFSLILVKIFLQIEINSVQISKNFIKGQTPGKLTGCGDNFAQLD